MSRLYLASLAADYKYADAPISIVSSFLRIVGIAEAALSRFVREHQAESYQLFYDSARWLGAARVMDEKDFQEVRGREQLPPWKTD